MDAIGEPYEESSYKHDFEVKNATLRSENIHFW
jgi:hypothetical protein